MLTTFFLNTFLLSSLGTFLIQSFTRLALGFQSIPCLQGIQVTFKGEELHYKGLELGLDFPRHSSRIPSPAAALVASSL